jgi:hypothetical protein
MPSYEFEAIHKAWEQRRDASEIPAYQKIEPELQQPVLQQPVLQEPQAAMPSSGLDRSIAFLDRLLADKDALNRFVKYQVIQEKKERGEVSS